MLKSDYISFMKSVVFKRENSHDLYWFIYFIKQDFLFFFFLVSLELSMAPNPMPFNLILITFPFLTSYHRCLLSIPFWFLEPSFLRGHWHSHLDPPLSSLHTISHTNVAFHWNLKVFLYFLKCHIFPLIGFLCPYRIKSRCFLFCFVFRFYFPERKHRSPYFETLHDWIWVYLLNFMDGFAWYKLLGEKPFAVTFLKVNLLYSLEFNHGNYYSFSFVRMFYNIFSISLPVEAFRALFNSFKIIVTESGDINLLFPQTCSVADLPKLSCFRPESWLLWFGGQFRESSSWGHSSGWLCCAPAELPWMCCSAATRVTSVHVCFRPEDMPHTLLLYWP